MPATAWWRLLSLLNLNDLSTGISFPDSVEIVPTILNCHHLAPWLTYILLCIETQAYNCGVVRTNGYKHFFEVWHLGCTRACSKVSAGGVVTTSHVNICGAALWSAPPPNSYIAYLLLKRGTEQRCAEVVSILPKALQLGVSNLQGQNIHLQASAWAPNRTSQVCCFRIVIE